MTSIPRLLAVVAVAVGLPAALGAQRTPTDDVLTPAQESCATAWRPEPGSYGYWQWHTGHNLDCAIGLVEQHLEQAPSGESATVAVQRDDLERLRSLIRLGKDAAFRADAHGQ